jgi:hypothetical protein
MNREQLLAHAERVRDRARTLTDAGRHDDARELLGDLATQLADALGAGDDDRRNNEVATALADTYGMLGGVETRAGDLRAATAVYARGREIEQSERYGIVDSYNLTNAIVLGILQDPPSLTTRGDELSAARATVRTQVGGPRGRQWWAWADYGLLCLLSGEDAEATRAYNQFVVGEPTPSDYDSVTRVLQRLAAAIDPVDPARARAVRTQITVLGHLR